MCADDARPPLHAERSERAAARVALPDRAPLDGGPNLPELAYDAQSARLLRQLEQRLIGQLHGVEKGSDTHLDLRAQIGPVKDRLALIELEQALEDVSLAKMSRDELKALSDKMHAARVAAHRMGAHKVRNAITTMARALPDGKPAAARAPGAAAPANDRRALPGLVVADEDHLHALIGSHASGCMAAVGGFNCAALAAYLRDAQYKLTRVYQDGKPVARSTWRIYRATLPGYEGPVLWVDRPNPFSHQVAVPAAAYELHAKAALSKAKRLGIPLVFSTQYGLQAQLPGIQQLQGSLHIDMGHTGLHQTEQTGTYMVGWKKWLGHNGYVHGGVPDDQTSTALNIPMNVVMPN